MKASSIPKPVWIAGGVILAGIAWIAVRPRKPGDTGNPVVDVTRDVVDSLFGVVSGAIGGIVQGGAAMVGVPTTSENACCKAIEGYDKAKGTLSRIGSAFEVSFRCPAADYLRWAAGKGRPAHCPKRPVVSWEMEGGRVIEREPKSLYFDPFSAITEELK